MRIPSLIFLIFLPVGLSKVFSCKNSLTENITKDSYNTEYLTGLLESLPNLLKEEIENENREEVIQIESFEECLEHIIPVNFTESNQLSVPHFNLINVIYNNIVGQLLNYLLKRQDPNHKATTRPVTESSTVKNTTTEEDTVNKGVFKIFGNILKTVQAQHPKVFNGMVITNIAITFLLVITLSTALICKYRKKTRTAAAEHELVSLNPSAPFYQTPATRVGQNSVRRLR